MPRKLTVNYWEPVKTGSKVAVIFQPEDAAGNKVNQKGLFVYFVLGDGTANGTFSKVKYNPNGTYTATFTATAAGTNTITATIGTTSTNGQLLTSPPPTITITAKPTAGDEVAVGGAARVEA